MSVRYICFAACILTACNTQETSDLTTNFRNFKWGDNAYYGFLYTSPPPEGKSLSVTLNESYTVDACELYGSDADKLEITEFRYVGLELGSVEPGDFTVVANRQRRDEASVRFVHVVSFKAESKKRATRGRVTLKDVVDKERNKLRLSVEADFPTRQPIDFECSTGTVDGIHSNTCTCKYDDGEETNCTPNAQENCCIAHNDSYERFKADITATFCRSMCRVSYPDLAQYCYNDD